jgi:hypothetical protein
MRASLLAITIAATACGSGDKPAPAADTAVKLVGVSGTRNASITCSGSIADGSYGVTPAGIGFKLVAPAGTSVTLGTTTIDAGASVTLDPLALADGIHAGDSFTIPVHITLADGSSPSASLTCSSAAIGMTLRRISSGALDWKAADDTPDDLAIVVHADGRLAYVGASTKPLAAADVIAFEPGRPPANSPACKLAVYDRRTGAHRDDVPCASPDDLLKK